MRFSIILCAAMFSAVVAPAATAQTNSQVRGGPGGAEFYEICPAGHYLTGLRMRAGAAIDGIRAVCGKWNAATSTLDGEVRLAYRGGTGGSPTSLHCPDNMAIRYLAVSIADNEWQSIGGLMGICRRLPARRNDGHHLPIVGTWREDTFPVGIECPEDFAAIGVRGRYGNLLDAVGLICGAQPVAGEAPDYSQRPAVGSIALRAGFLPDPHVREIPAGGQTNAAVLGWGCVGWIARAPDYRLDWTEGPGGRPLIFSVESSADTTLVVNDASGNWLCDDDGGVRGANPSIRVNTPQSGQYDIWIGTYEQGGFRPATLHISEETSQ